MKYLVLFLFLFAAPAYPFDVDTSFVVNGKVKAKFTASQIEVFGPGVQRQRVYAHGYDVKEGITMVDFDFSSQPMTSDFAFINTEKAKLSEVVMQRARWGEAETVTYATNNYNAKELEYQSHLDFGEHVYANQVSGDGAFEEKAYHYFDNGIICEEIISKKKGVGLFSGYTEINNFIEPPPVFGTKSTMCPWVDRSAGGGGFG